MFKISDSLKKNIAQVLCLTIAFTPVIGYAAGSGRAANLQSHGKVNYTNGTDNVVIDSSDLVTLANEIDTLEENAKWGQVQALQSLPAVAQKNSLTGVTLDTIGNVTFDQINNAIKNSQKVNPNGDEKVYVNNTNGRAEAAGTSGATEVQITGATANNLSAGTAAWVDGQYIVGNGSNNKSYYNLGYADGYSKIENGNVTYAYHSHVGDPDNGGDCYSPIYHKHTSSCYKTVSACNGWTKWSSNGNQVCRVCGWTTYAPSASGGMACGRTTTTLSCTKSNDIIGYSLSCGKTEATVESVIITF